MNWVRKDKKAAKLPKKNLDPLAVNATMKEVKVAPHVVRLDRETIDAIIFDKHSAIAGG